MASGASDLIRIGTIGKPHGVRGAFNVLGAIDAEAMRPGFKFYAGERELTVVARAGTGERPIVTAEEISDRDEAAALRGREIFAPRSSLTPLGEGEWYASDLEGMAVVDSTGETIGAVMRLVNMPSVDLLEVERPGATAPLLVPMVKDAIVGIDAEARAITVDREFLNLD